MSQQILKQHVVIHERDQESDPKPWRQCQDILITFNLTSLHASMQVSNTTKRTISVKLCAGALRSGAQLRCSFADEERAVLEEVGLGCMQCAVGLIVCLVPLVAMLMRCSAESLLLCPAFQARS